MDIELEEYIEEVKFQMTEYEEMTKEIIVDWEKKTRKMVMSKMGYSPRLKRHREDVLLQIRTEADMEEMAERYYTAVIENKTEAYWDDCKRALRAPR